MENLALNQVLAEKKKFVNKREFRKIAEEAVKKINFDVGSSSSVKTPKLPPFRQALPA